MYLFFVFYQLYCKRSALHQNSAPTWSWRLHTWAEEWERFHSAKSVLNKKPNCSKNMLLVWLVIWGFMVDLEMNRRLCRDSDWDYWIYCPDCKPWSVTSFAVDSTSTLSGLQMSLSSLSCGNVKDLRSSNQITWYLLVCHTMCLPLPHSCPLPLLARSLWPGEGRCNDPSVQLQHMARLVGNIKHRKGFIFFAEPQIKR